MLPLEREGGTIVRRVPIRRFGPTNLNYLSHDVSPCLPVSLSFRAAGNFLGLRTVIVYTLLLHHSIVTFPPLLVRTRSPAIRFRAPLSVHFARPIRPAPHPPGASPEAPRGSLRTLHGFAHSKRLPTSIR
ncbi:hypothetical protein VTO73DRAFT_1045 [Trametes versicolor]